MSNFDDFNEIHEMLENVPGLPSAMEMEKGMAFVRLATPQGRDPF
jgi:hypothetical protein